MFFSIASETTSPSCDSRVENFWSVMRDLGSVVAKTRKWDRVFFLIKNTEQNGPLSESRAEQIGPLSVIRNEFFLVALYPLSLSGFIVAICDKTNVCLSAFMQRLALIAHFLVFSWLFLIRNDCSLF